MRIFKSGSIKLAFILLLISFKVTEGQAQILSLVNQPGKVIKHPKVSYDGTQMVLIADYDGRFKPYITSVDTGYWQTPQLLFDQEINGRFDFKYPQLNFDNTVIYFSGRRQDKADYDIFYTELKNGKWGDPKLLSTNVNSALDELSPSISVDDKRMLFTRPLPEEAKTDEECQQIYLSEKDGKGNWSGPKLLPSVYNTGCVCAPSYANDSKTFYFSSRQEVLDAEGKRTPKRQFNVFWGKIDGSLQYNPKPIVSIISVYDNISFSMNPDSTMYYGSGDIFGTNSKKWVSTVRSEILSRQFRAEPMALISGTVKNAAGSPIAATVKVIDPYTSNVYQELQSDDSGYYQIFLPSQKQFSILASKEDYSIQSQLVTTTSEDKVIDFNLFQGIEMTFNIYDADFFFPLNTKMSLYDSAFNELEVLDIVSGGGTTVNIGKEYNVIFSTEDYFVDTLNLPFDEEVLFSQFDFDIELGRKLKEVGLSFTDDETGNSLGLEITVFNVTRNEKTRRLVKDGNITLELRDGEVYEISTSAQGYSYFTSELDLSKDEEVKTMETAKEGELFLNSDGVFEVKAALKSVENQAIVLNDITFGANSYDLNAFSYAELNKLVTYLLENMDYQVEVAAHTDNAGPADYNLKLSNLRANIVVEYMQDHAIQRSRLIAKGYGEENPISPNDTDANKAKNRRVEFKIINDSE